MTQQEIVNGPSKFDLMLALFDYRVEDGKTINRKVTFTYSFPGRGVHSFQATINGVESVYSEDEEWSIIITLGYINPVPLNGSRGSMMLNLLYSTKARKGEFCNDSLNLLHQKLLEGCIIDGQLYSLKKQVP